MNVLRVVAAALSAGLVSFYGRKIYFVLRGLGPVRTLLPEARVMKFCASLRLKP